MVLIFIILSNVGAGFESKNKFTFLKLSDNPLSKYLIFEKTSCNEMTALGYLPKSKKGLEIAFGVHFLHDFTIKMFFI